MSEQATSSGTDRSAAKTRLLAKLERYASLLRQRWWIPALGLALGLLVQFAHYQASPPLYSSLGRMIVNIKLSLPEGSVYTEELSNFLGTQSSLMQSGVVIDRAHARVLNLMTNPVVQPVGLRVNVLPRTTIFMLQATGTDPRYTELFLQSCMEEYVNLKKEMRLQTSETTLAGLTEEVLRMQKELKKADEDLADFQSSNSVVLLQEQGNSAGNYVAALNTRVATLKSELELLKSMTPDQNLERQHQLGANLPLAGSPMVKGAEGGTAETDYQRARQQVAMLKAEMDDLGQYLKARHPKMVLLAEEITRREKLLEIYHQQSVEQLESRKTALALQIENLDREIREWDAKVLEISRKTAQYQKLKSDVQRVQVLYDRLLATMQTLDVNKEISPESVTIMERASGALANRPSLLRKLLLGAVAGLLASFLVLLLMDRLDDRVMSITELQEIFDEPVLGQVPQEKPAAKGGDVALIQPDDPRFNFVEAYRNLRSSIFFFGGEKTRPKVLLVTSSVPNEGKSLTACNLAISMAEAGSRVLLVDADLRKGVLHSRFGLSSGPGVSECLSRVLNWQEAIQKTSYPSLSLLARGALTQRSSELFMTQETSQFLKEAAPQYDYVLLDTAPVMAADDVGCLAPQVDGVLFVLRAEHPSARVARAALQLLYQRRSKVLGIVFNCVRRTSSDYYYYKYHNYYRAYPEQTASTEGRRAVH